MQADSQPLVVECEINNDAPFFLFEKVENGKKIFELRLLLPTKPGEQPTKWWSLYPGRFKEASLAVVCANDKTRRFTRRIRRTLVGTGYRSVIDTVGHERCVPGSLSTEDAIERVYKRFYADKLEGFEVLAIELEQ